MYAQRLLKERHDSEAEEVVLGVLGRVGLRTLLEPLRQLSKDVPLARQLAAQYEHDHPVRMQHTLPYPPPNNRALHSH